MADNAYRGWTISFDYPPIPCRHFDWVAMHPDYEAWTEEGIWVSNNLCLHAPSREALLVEIEEWEAEMANA